MVQASLQDKQEKRFKGKKKTLEVPEARLLSSNILARADIPSESYEDIQSLHKKIFPRMTPMLSSTFHLLNASSNPELAILQTETFSYRVLRIITVPLWPTAFAYDKISKIDRIYEIFCFKLFWPTVSEAAELRINLLPRAGDTNWLRRHFVPNLVSKESVFSLFSFGRGRFLKVSLIEGPCSVTSIYRSNSLRPWIVILAITLR